LAILKIPTAKVFEPLLAPARYKGVYGGRGSGKSHFFGELLVETCQAERGTLAVCIREAQRTLAQSSKRLIESKIASLGVGSGFKLFHDKIETPGDGLIIFRGLQDHTAESIKSLEGFRIAWVDEAQTLSARSLAQLRPTIRAENSELWASWKSLGMVEYALLAQGRKLAAWPLRSRPGSIRPVALGPPGFFAFWDRFCGGVAMLPERLDPWQSAGRLAKLRQR
jgi:terminase large subunit-like protein